MGWTFTNNPAGHHNTAGEFLHADPVANTVLLTVLDALRTRGGRTPGLLSGWWTSPDGTVEGVYHQARPYPSLLTVMPNHAVRELATELARRKAQPTGLTAREDLAELFAAEWRTLTGIEAEVRTRQRLYALETLTLPENPPEGEFRTARAADRALVFAWYEAFAEEEAAGWADPAVIETRLEAGAIGLWELDGTPVSLAGRTQVVAGMARVAPVYTPPELRGHGYASAVTAGMSVAAREAGAKDVVLFTNLENPVSNRIYQRLGYRPRHDCLDLAFRP